MIFETRTVAPAGNLVTTALAKAWLRVDHDDEDDLIDDICAAAERLVETLTGRALITQTWRIDTRVPEGGGLLALPRVPVASLSAVAYLDGAEVLQTATLSDFVLVAGADRAYAKPAEGKAWPATHARPDALRLTYVAGYGATAAAVPDDLITAARLIVAHLYRNREAVSEKAMQAVPMAVASMIEPYRTLWVAG